MNLFEKIQKIRVELQNRKLKMSGRNDYSGYDYFELEDFINPLNELMDQYKMTAIPSFTSENATLTAINIEKLDEIFVITSPFGSASLKGCHEVQNIGAVETYQRRYLYQAMFDISEHDSLNATQGKKDDKKDDDKPLTLAVAKEKKVVIGDSEIKLDKLTVPQLESLVNSEKPEYQEMKEPAKLVLEFKKNGK